MAYELAEHDLDLGDEEEEEWRKYDEEVKQFQELMNFTGQSPASLRQLAGEDHGATLPGLMAATAAAKASQTGAQRELDSILQSTSEMETQLKKLLEQNAALRQQEAATAATAAIAPWVPGAEGLVQAAGQQSLPAEYRARLAEGDQGVIVSSSLGPNTVVLLSRVPDQPELLPVLSETFRGQGVRIMRGWLENAGDGVMDAFEVTDLEGRPLSNDSAARLEKAIVQALRAPLARQVLWEIEDQVPRLDAFFGLPLGGSRAPSLPAARGALMDSPLFVTEGKDLWRVLVFRVQQKDDTPIGEALKECRSRLRKACFSDTEGSGAEGNRPEDWECVLVDGVNGLLLLVLPSKDLEQALLAPYDQRLFFMLCTLLSVVCAQAAAPSEPGNLPPVGSMLLAVVGAAELMRVIAADWHGVRLGLPILLPSTAIGSFGAATRFQTMVPDAVALFDIAASATTAAFAVSFALVALGLTVPADVNSCTWVNPSSFPYALKQFLLVQAEGHFAVCTNPPQTGGSLIPTSTVLAAGCFGALMTALNALPLGRVDGMWIAAAAPSARLRDTFLPWTAMALLGTATFGPDADGLFPLVLGFSVFTFWVRPQLTPEPVRRDNLTEPDDLFRRCYGLLLLLLAATILLPSAILEPLLTLLPPWK